jgi:hypothetical protein
MLAFVFHKINPTFDAMINRKPDPSALFLLSEFKPVAAVSVHCGTDENACDQAFELTNHIDKPYWENPDVAMLTMRNQRSTSVGDLIRVEKQYYLVAPVGFTKVNVQEAV